MPVEFLTDREAATYGRYVGVPSRSELKRVFFLDDADMALVGRRREGVRWLRRGAVLLPGVTTLARLVARVREEATRRLYQTLQDLLTLSVPKIVSPYATCLYSWMSPPRRSLRST